MTSKEWRKLTDEQVSIIKAHQFTFPIKVGAIAKDFGLIVKSSTLPGNISGEIKETCGEIVIRVNRHDVKYRQRFTLAHEISHYLLHRKYIGDGITDDALFRSKLSSSIESEANSLAADILMPMHLLAMHKKECEIEIKGEVLYEKLAEDFEVSLTSLKYQLEKYRG
ncbi:MAG: ImmA/IrrE family metallo-endopeptidase [Candidatus Oceanisphaera merdipullorum]|nr:ImmA/IrrE family metallo-endopeptidase [Candidatus Oceanisphaera merdipullorum]